MVCHVAPLSRLPAKLNFDPELPLPLSVPRKTNRSPVWLSLIARVSPVDHSLLTMGAVGKVRNVLCVSAPVLDDEEDEDDEVEDELEDEDVELLELEEDELGALELLDALELLEELGTEEELLDVGMLEELETLELLDDDGTLDELALDVELEFDELELLELDRLELDLALSAAAVWSREQPASINRLASTVMKPENGCRNFIFTEFTIDARCE